MEYDPDESEILRKRMDKKVEQKAKEDEEKELAYKEKLKEKMETKKREAEKRLEEEKRKRQQLKQSQKDLRKSVTKKIRKFEENLTRNEIRVPNIKNVPENVKHLVKEDDVIYQVPGDGSCGPSSAAAFLFSDEIF